MLCPKVFDCTKNANVRSGSERNPGLSSGFSVVEMKFNPWLDKNSFHYFLVTAYPECFFYYCIWFDDRKGLNFTTWLFHFYFAFVPFGASWFILITLPKSVLILIGIIIQRKSQMFLTANSPFCHGKNRSIPSLPFGPFSAHEWYFISSFAATDPPPPSLTIVMKRTKTEGPLLERAQTEPIRGGNKRELLEVKYLLYASERECPIDRVSIHWSMVNREGPSLYVARIWTGR